MYNYNLLVSCKWNRARETAQEVTGLLKEFGDPSPIIERTLARGIVGVQTRLDARETVSNIRKLFQSDPTRLEFAIKWVPIDSWVQATLPALVERVKQVAGQIGPKEAWRTIVEKRRFTKYHSEEIIRTLEVHIKSKKIDLHNPDKILRIDILGKWAGVTILKPEDVFSTAKPEDDPFRGSRLHQKGTLSKT